MSGSSPRLKVLKNGQVEHDLPLTQALTVGRHQKADLQLEHPEMSRLHAHILYEGGQWYLQDNGSMNGTFMAGRRLDSGERCELQDGTVVRVGGFELHFELPGLGSSTAVQPRIHPAAAVSSGMQAQPLDAAPTPAPAASSASAPELEAPPEAGPLLSGLVAGRARIPVWSAGETELVVADIIAETHDVKTFRLVGREPLMFSYKPGQFITLSLEIEGQLVRRSYSISSSPSRPHTLELTVKRVAGGLVSNWLCDNLRLGATLAVRGPSGKFSCFDYPSRKMLFIAAGSGITPIMSMTRWIVDTTADVDVILLVSARTPQDIIFRKELENMAARNSNFRLVVTVTSGTLGTEAWSGFMGRCSGSMIRMIAPDLDERHVFMCGPKPFGDASKECLLSVGFPLENLHTESFGGSRVATGTEVEPRDVSASDSILLREARARKPVAQPLDQPAREASAAVPQPVSEAAAAAPEGAGFAVSFVRSGRTVQTDGEASLLDLAEANGIEIDYACRAGCCGSCKVKLVRGDLTEDDNELEDEDRASGWRYACVSRPCGDVEIEA